MKRLLTCMAVLLTVVLMTYYVQDDLAEGLPVSRALTAGFMVLGAWLTGRIVDRLGLPTITGYLLFGLAVSPSLWSMLPLESIGGRLGEIVRRATPLISQDQLKQMRFIGDLAVSLIALTAGGEIDMRWLRERLGKLTALLAVDTVFTLAVMVGVVVLGRPWLGFLDGLDSGGVAVVAALAAVVLVSNSPTVVIAMLSELRASGPLSQMTLAFVVCKDLVLIVLFATAMSLGQGVLTGAAISGWFLLAVAAQLLGSIAVGAVVGVGMAMFARNVREHLMVFVIGCCMLLALMGEQPFHLGDREAHLEPLLMALSAGLVMKNVWPRYSAAVFHNIEAMSLPVYALFFAAAGAGMDLRNVGATWYVAAVLVAARAVAVWIGMTLGVRLTRLEGAWTSRLWYGLIPQAGVSLVLVGLIERSFRGASWVEGLKGTLITVIVITQIVGPIGFRRALAGAGEIGRADGRS